MKKIILAALFALLANSANAQEVISGVVGRFAAVTLPKASTSVLGGVKCDGTTITCDANGVITAVGAAAAGAGNDKEVQWNNDGTTAGTALLTVGPTALSQGLTTFTAKPTFVGVGTTTASINIPVGTQAPSSPVSGDVWVTDGMYVQVGTTTQGPLGVPAGSSGTLQYNNAGIFGGLAIGGNLTTVNSTINTTQPADRTVTGATDTITSSDCGIIINYNRNSSIAVGIAAASSTGLTQGCSFTVNNINTGTATITPTTSLINGGASLAIPANTGCLIRSDSTNYLVDLSACSSVVVGSLSAIGSNTLLSNFTGSAAVPSANAVPSCSTDGAHALTYTLGTGLSCTAVTGGAATIVSVGTTGVDGGSAGQALGVGVGTTALLDSFDVCKPSEIDGHAAASPAASVLTCGATIYNYGQAAADVNITLPTAAANLVFVADVGTAQAANYWRFTAADAGTMYLDAGATGKNYVQFAAPAVGNYLVCHTFKSGASAYSWTCRTGAGTVTTN